VKSNKVPQENPGGNVPAPAPVQGNGKGKYITLAILLAWVVGVLIFTMLKFKGFNR
jgi:hypothetical protein